MFIFFFTWAFQVKCIILSSHIFLGLVSSLAVLLKRHLIVLTMFQKHMQYSYWHVSLLLVFVARDFYLFDEMLQ